MTSVINLVFCALVVLTSSSPTKGQNSPPILTPAALPSETGASASPVLPLAERDATQNPGRHPATQSSAVQDGTATVAVDDGGVQSEAVTGDGTEVMTTRVTTPRHTAAAHLAETVSPRHPTAASPSAAPGSPSSTSPTVESDTPPDTSPPTDADPSTTSAPPSTPPSQDGPPDEPSARPGTEALTQTPARPQTSAPSRAPAGPSHLEEVPPELNVGDDDIKEPHHHPSSPLDPLLAGLVSVFIVTTAIISVVLFLKFRQRTDHPEFHRLQDLPMSGLPPTTTTTAAMQTPKDEHFGIQVKPLTGHMRGPQDTPC